MAPSRGFQSIQINPYVCHRCYRRPFTTSTTRLSGHNRWSKIKHDKGKNDAAKNRQRSIFAQEIAIASKLYGPDPASNGRLADVITKAKREGFAKASIEAAIARGQGRGVSGQQLESLTVEGILPGNVGVVVECETDNKARTLTLVRHAMKEAGGASSPSAYLFEKRGRVVFESEPGKGLEQVLDVALDAGATDIEEHDDGGFTVICEPSDTIAVGDAILRTVGLQVASSEIVWQPIPDTLVAIPNEEAARELGSFIDELQDKEPATSVSMNVAPGTLSDEIWRDLQTRLRV